jgi:hypothetical protein
MALDIGHIKLELSAMVDPTRGESLGLIRQLGASSDEVDTRLVGLKLIHVNDLLLQLAHRNGRRYVEVGVAVLVVR